MPLDPLSSGPVGQSPFVQGVAFARKSPTEYQQDVDKSIFQLDLICLWGDEVTKEFSGFAVCCLGNIVQRPNNQALCLAVNRCPSIAT